MTQEWSEELRYNYPLNKDSIVLDIGGFHGEWAYGIYSKYSCHVFVFEPVKEFYEVIKSKFPGRDKVHVYNYGLGAKDETLSIGVSGSITSVFNKTENNNQQVEIKDILPIVSKFVKIDILKINIEGAEYALLDYIIEKGLQTKMSNIQIQFHINVEDFENKRQIIRQELSKTHRLTYDYAYTWENWRIK